MSEHIDGTRHTVEDGATATGSQPLEATGPTTDRSRGPGPYRARPALFSALHRFAPGAPLVLRLAIGPIMIAHGVSKVHAGPTEAWGGFFDALGLPVPVVLAWTVTAIELLGGICLVLGLFTRLAALLFSAVMLGAIYLVSAKLGLRSGPQGPGADLNLALLGGAVAIALVGPGRFALDVRIGLERDP